MFEVETATTPTTDTTKTYPGINPGTITWAVVDMLHDAWLTNPQIRDELTRRGFGRANPSGPISRLEGLGYVIARREGDGFGKTEYHLEHVATEAEVAAGKRVEAERFQEAKRRRAGAKAKAAKKQTAVERRGSKKAAPEPITPPSGHFIPDMALDAPVFGSHVQVGLLQLTDDEGLRIGVRDDTGTWWVCRVEGRMDGDSASSQGGG